MDGFQFLVSCFMLIVEILDREVRNIHTPMGVFEWTEIYYKLGWKFHQT
jgi:hypothetical protein